MGSSLEEVPVRPTKVNKEISFCFSVIVMNVHVADGIVWSFRMLFSYFLGLSVLSDTYYIVC